jgi:hypothetical protein
VAAVPVLAGLLSAGPVTAGPITAGSIAAGSSAATVLVTRVPAPTGATTALTTATAAVPAPRHTADGTGDLTNHSRAAISVPGPTPGRAFTATRATGTVPATPAIPGVPTSTLTITTAAASHHTDGTDDLTDNAGSTTGPGTTAPTGGRALVPPSAAARRHAPDDMIELDDVATLRSPAIAACDEATTALRRLVARPAGVRWATGGSVLPFPLLMPFLAREHLGPARGGPVLSAGAVRADDVEDVIARRDGLLTVVGQGRPDGAPHALLQVLQLRAFRGSLAEAKIPLLVEGGDHRGLVGGQLRLCRGVPQHLLDRMEMLLGELQVVLRAVEGPVGVDLGLERGPTPLEQRLAVLQRLDRGRWHCRLALLWQPAPGLFRVRDGVELPVHRGQRHLRASCPLVLRLPLRLRLRPRNGLGRRCRAAADRLRGRDGVPTGQDARDAEHCHGPPPPPQRRQLVRTGTACHPGQHARGDPAPRARGARGHAARMD